MFACELQKVEAANLLIGMGANVRASNALEHLAWMYYVNSYGNAPLNADLLTALTEQGNLLQDNASYVFCKYPVNATHVDGKLSAHQELINQTGGGFINFDKITLEQYRALETHFVKVSAGRHTIGFSYSQRSFTWSSTTTETGENVNVVVDLVSKGVYRVRAQSTDSTWSPVVERVY